MRYLHIPIVVLQYGGRNINILQTHDVAELEGFLELLGQ